jgi:mycothiol synthase
VASVEVRAAEPAEAQVLLDRLAGATGIPPVDEDEARRLAGLTPVRDPGWDWGGHLVVVDSEPVAYAGVRLAPLHAGGSAGAPHAPGPAARVDLAVDRSHPAAQRALAAGLADVRDHARRRGVPGAPDAPGAVEAWLRGAGDEDLATAAGEGFVVRSRLHVLGAAAATLAGAVAAAPAVPDDLTLRAFDPGDPADAQAVVTLLSRAYPELDGWFGDGFAVLQQAGWFRAEDLLLLGPGSDGLAALHWMKRRGDGVGEVYNLAVDPSAQGRGLGPLMLDVGLRHLVDIGCREVVLWVDAENARALALYRSRGFEHRWDDVSLAG